jgi:hypothetical protein
MAFLAPRAGRSSGKPHTEDQSASLARLFKEETLADINEKFRTIGGRTDRTVLRYVYHAYKSTRAQEFAHHGFVRRVRILQRCIENVRADPAGHGR